MLCIQILAARSTGNFTKSTALESTSLIPKVEGELTSINLPPRGTTCLFVSIGPVHPFNNFFFPTLISLIPQLDHPCLSLPGLYPRKDSSSWFSQGLLSLVFNSVTASFVRGPSVLNVSHHPVQFDDSNFFTLKQALC
jgi:hypothetical protein